jgi:THO complex subunit 2
VPAELYASTVKRLQDALQALEPKAAAGAAGAAGAAAAADEEKKRRKERERITKTIQKLKLEAEEQQKNHVSVMARLKQEKDNWIRPSPSEEKEVVVVFMQRCLLPRCFTSPIDALFCARFVEVVQEIGTPNLSILYLYHQLIQALAAIIRTATSNEVRGYSRLLKAVLEKWTRWQGDSALYVHECQEKPGFTLTPKTPQDLASRCNFQRFCELVSRWHNQLCSQFVTALQSSSPHHVHNALSILARLSECV